MGKNLLLYEITLEEKGKVISISHVYPNLTLLVLFAYLRVVLEALKLERGQWEGLLGKERVEQR